VLPGETVTFEVVDADPRLGYVAQPAGRARAAGRGALDMDFAARPRPLSHPCTCSGPGERGHAAGIRRRPVRRLQGELLNGYRIAAIREAAPRARQLQGAGRVRRVTQENEDELVSPHFRLKQFVCKQQAGSRKYVVLNERLLLALEHGLDRVNEAGFRATTFHVMSGTVPRLQRFDRQCAL